MSASLTTTSSFMVPDQRSPLRTLRLLCVEDNDYDFRLLNEHLREVVSKMPMELKRAVRLVDAIRLIESASEHNEFDVILLDLSLPDSQGLATYDAIRAAGPNMAIIILSGNADEELALSMVQHGAQDYLPKDALNGDLLWRSILYAGERQRLRIGLRRVNERLLAAQDDLKTAQMQLIQSEKLDSLGRIAASVAHEVKNPLATLQMGTDYFESQASTLGPVGRRMVECMQEAIQRAEGIIHEMLDFSRCEKLQLEHRGVNDVTAAALRMVLPELLERHISIHEDYEPSNPLINVDHSKMEQVMINLLFNAAHAMPDGGVIDVRTFRTVVTHVAPDAGLREMDLLKNGDEAVVIEIRDRGTGIPLHLMDRIFEPFFTTKPPGEGTGLGLPVVKRIVDLHRGLLHIENVNPPPGVSVRITLKSHSPVVS